MTKNRLRFAILAVAIFLYVGRHYYGELHRLRDAHWAGIAAIALVYLLTCAIQGRILQIALSSLNEPIRLQEGFFLATLSAYSNLLLPRSGIGLVGVYLHRVRHCQLAKYGSVVMLNAGLFVAVSIGATLTMLLGWRGPLSLWSGSIAVLALLLALCVAFLIVSHSRLAMRYHGPGWRFLRRTARAWKRLNKPTVFFQILLLHVVMLFLRAFRLYLAFSAIGIHVSFGKALMASLFGDLAFMISLTPTALGFREAAIMYMAGACGMAHDVALSAALLDRLVFSLTAVCVAQGIIAFALRGPSFGWSGRSIAESHGARPLGNINR